MIKLIKTNLIYNSFNAVFLIAAAAMLWLGINGGMEAIEYDPNFDTLIFGVLIVAAVTLLNVGREHQDGTLRNKLVLGYTRAKIFFSLMISSIASTLVLFSLMGIPYFAMVHSHLKDKMPDEKLWQMVFIVFCVYLVVTVGAVCAALSLTRLPVAAVAVLAAGIGFVMLTTMLSDRLRQPEYIEGYEYYDWFDEDTFDWESDVMPYQIITQKNESYVDGTKRDIYKALYFADPFSHLRIGQSVSEIYCRADTPAEVRALLEEFEKDPVGIGFDAEEIAAWPYLPIYSAVLILLLTAAGAVLFVKRNLN